MPLGIEQNNIAPELIQSNGQALVQNIRQIGQQISQHLTEIQTKRDLSSLGQEAQTLNPRSTDFPVQLTQLVSKHPLAIRDERGQMVLSILGKEHGAWQAEESDARAFNRAMALQTRRTSDAQNTFTFEQDYKRTHPQFLPGVGVTTLEDPNDPTGNPNVLLPVAPKGVAPGQMPYATSAEGIYDRRTGEIKSAAAPRASESRLQKKANIDLLMRQDAAARAEIGRIESRRDALSKQRMETNKPEDISYLDNTVKAIEGQVAELRKRRLDIQKAIQGFEATPAADIPSVLGAAASAQPALGLLPVPTDAASAPAAGANVRRVPVLDPSGTPLNLREDQLDAALQAGWKRR